MDSTIRTIAWSASLSAVLVGMLIWLLRHWLSTRLVQSVRNEYAKELENHKAQLKSRTDTELASLRAMLEERSRAQQSRFNKEFKGYQSLWEAVSQCVDRTILMLRLYNFSEIDGSGMKAQRGREADSACLSGLNVCQSLRPFVAQEVYDRANTLLALCKTSIDKFLHDQKLEARVDSSYDQSGAAKIARSTAAELEVHWSQLSDVMRSNLERLSGGSPATPAPVRESTPKGS